MAEAPERRHSLRKSQLIDFPNVAAGHDGVLASQSGDLIVKPCKTAELLFYQQTWKSDPDDSELAYYMPKFYGTLNLQEHPPSSPSLPSAAVAAAAATSPTTAISPTLTSPTLHSPTQDRRASHVSTLSAPGTPRSTASRVGHARSPSRTSMISHLPVDEAFAPTKPPKHWEPTHGAKIDADTAVVMENVAAGLRKPNILDVKMGARLWADDAHPAKRQKLDKVAKETTSGSLGFRFAGMKVWAGHGAWEKENRDVMDTHGTNSAEVQLDRYGLPKPSIREDDYASYEREYGRALTADTVRRGFEEYFVRPQAGIKPWYTHQIVSRFVEDIRGLIKVMEKLETRMYSASLLFVYEGDGEALGEDLRREDRMIREAREQAEAMGANFDRIALDASSGPEQSRVEVITSPHHVASLQTQHMAPQSISQIMEAAEEATATGASSQQTSLPQLSLQAPAASQASLPTLPQISVGSSLDIPAQLVLSDEQLAAATTLSDEGILGELQEEDDDEEEEDDDDTMLPKIQALKVIDFAHASWATGQGPDENFLDGVRNVLKILEDLLESQGE